MCSNGHTPARSARSSGTPAVSRDASSDCTTSAIRPTSTGSSDRASAVRPGRNWATASPMSIGGRRCRSSQSADRSAIRRQSRNRSSWTSSGTSPVSASISAHRPAKSSTSRATTHARVTSTTDAPVSSVIRWSNEMPDRLTIWLTMRVEMISRRSGCWRMASA